MKLSEKLQKYLEEEPRARERANKNRAMGNLLLKEYQLIISKNTGQEVDLTKSKEIMEVIIKETLSLDRHWRKILEENPELRGKDYGEKDELEHRKLKELGYE